MTIFLKKLNRYTCRKLGNILHGWILKVITKATIVASRIEGVNPVSDNAMKNIYNLLLLHQAKFMLIFI